jgi:hypothetical protein
MTMLEILVALGILAVAIGSILTIFHAGARHGARAQEKMEAGRVALAVFDLVDRGFTLGGPPWYGRDRTTGEIMDTTTPFESQQLSGMDGGQPSWRPAYVTDSPVLLVWSYEITSLDPATTDGVQLHRLSVTVSIDEDGDLFFDPEPTDRVIRVYEAILADRRVAP